jgi:ATP-dependent helicase HrpB
LPSLRVQRIARAAAAQRAGRAGRVRAGRCLRLYTRHDHDTRPAQETPEVQRADLAEALLLLHSVGERDAAAFDWLEAPSVPALAAAERLLERLGAVEAGALTPIGRRLLTIPAHPRHARMLVEAERRGVVKETALAAALLSEGPLLHGSRRGPAKVSGPSDVLDEMERFEEARRARFDGDRLRNLGIDIGAATSADRVRRQLEATVKPRAPRPLNGKSLDAAVGICVLAGYPDRVARRVREDQLLLAGGTTATLAPSSVVRSAPLLVALDAESRAATGTRGQVQVRLAEAIEPEWLVEVAASALNDETRVAWENNRAVVVASEIYDGLVLEERRRSPSSPDERRRAAELVLSAARDRLGLAEPKPPEVASDEEGSAEVEEPLAELGDERVGLLLRRVAFIRAARPNLELPALGASEVDAALRALVGDATSLNDVALDGSALAELLLDGLGPAGRRALDELAPERVTLPSGRRAVIEYPPPPGKPWLASRIQDFFGWKSSPTVAGAPVVLHLLAPNRRAVQVTADLAGFWERHYPTLRRQLSRRYPRHAWPEDPSVKLPPSTRK